MEHERAVAPALAGLVLIPLLGRAGQAVEPLDYRLDLCAPESHRLQVALRIPRASASVRIQFPAWNCLYQIRDFVKNVEELEGACDGKGFSPEREDMNTWRGPREPCRQLEFHYAVYANEDGPFGAILDAHHSFLNLALLLFYLPEARRQPIRVGFLLPAGWKLATTLEGDGEEFLAAGYDALMDSPVEAGHFEEFSYRQDLSEPRRHPRGQASPQDAGAPGGAPPAKPANIRLIIDADPADYSPHALLDSLEKITTEETSLMRDLPFRHYTFFLHFPTEGSAVGGMEHRDGAAIAVSASEMRRGQGSFEGVAAHEFFHAWNVKRIRPQSLEPVDYIHGNDTRDLWLCEGVTGTYTQLTLLRAGLIDRQEFYGRVARAIQALGERSARRFQSLETAGREAWLEKYPAYNRPDRSISYYNKGELAGYLLDLGLRHATGNHAGLDDVMRRLNQDFGRTGRFYTRADFSAINAQLAPAFDIDGFLADTVRGTRDLDYSAYLGYAGLRLSVRRESAPEKDGETGSREKYTIVEDAHATPAQRRVREGWLAGATTDE